MRAVGACGMRGAMAGVDRREGGAGALVPRDARPECTERRHASLRTAAASRLQRPRLMPPRSAGLLIIAAGVALIVIGLLVASGGLSWFGRLPGDIRVERENMRFYAPLTSMLLVSLVIGAVSWIVRRLL